jgi:hypothetical protein
MLCLKQHMLPAGLRRYRYYEILIIRTTMSAAKENRR